ncbi:hypothetical protein Q5O14_05425 [Eubacteriaceae bacterium ES2]|nr:hypothetical protein Q5O14_05425 [Eubacteriaceae bacterium ES2]
MENLITIETVPIKIEFVEKQPLDVSAVHNLQYEVYQQSGQKQIQSQPIRIAVQDSFEPSMAYQWENSTYTATSKIDADGNLRLNISMEDGRSQAIRFKQANRSIESMTSQANSFASGSMQISIPMTRLSSGKPEVNDVDTSFMPPDLELVVTQMPDVIIKYVGGPIYVPPSADPDYQPPIGFEKNSEIVQIPQILDEKV